MNSEFGIRLKKLRKKNNLSQEKLASILKITAGAVGNYERGERDISVTELNKLADLFGVELSDLLEENLEMQKLNLAFAFRSKNTESDLEYIASFKKVVRNYLKMERLENAL